MNLKYVPGFTIKFCPKCGCKQPMLIKGLGSDHWTAACIKCRTEWAFDEKNILTGHIEALGLDENEDEFWDIQEYLKDIMHPTKSRGWLSTHRVGVGGFNHDSWKDYWDPTPANCIGYPVRESCGREAYWHVCFGENYNPSDDLDKTVWFTYCDECYLDLKHRTRLVRGFHFARGQTTLDLWIAF